MLFVNFAWKLSVVQLVKDSNKQLIRFRSGVTERFIVDPKYISGKMFFSIFRCMVERQTRNFFCSKFCGYNNRKFCVSWSNFRSWFLARERKRPKFKSLFDFKRLKWKSSSFHKITTFIKFRLVHGTTFSVPPHLTATCDCPTSTHGIPTKLAIRWKYLFVPKKNAQSLPIWTASCFAKRGSIALQR